MAPLIPRVQIWFNQSILSAQNISPGINVTYGVIASANGDIYVHKYELGQVKKWAFNATSDVIVMNISGLCHGLALDIYGDLYCSLPSQVVKKTFSKYLNSTSVVAGTVSPGSTSNMLNMTRGIFVDLKLNLYVADYGNNRVQLFQRGQLNGTTVAGKGATGTIILINPTGIALDADGYLFITDFDHNRIIRSGPNGYQCLFGCTGNPGSASNQLYQPHSLSFDSYGNLFVADTYNNRIQKFLLVTNSCGQHSLLFENGRSKVFFHRRIDM